METDSLKCHLCPGSKSVRELHFMLLSQAQPVKKHTKVFQKRSGARISGIQLLCRLQSLLNL